MSEKQTVFTYLKLINKADKTDIEVDDEIYNQFLINRGLSYHIDTVAIANEMNKYGCISNQMHFDFMRNVVSPRNRYAKWTKPHKHGKAAVISQYYGITLKKAYEYIGIISDDKIERMEKELKVEKE